MDKLNISISDVFRAAEDRVGIAGWRAFQWKRATAGSIVRGAMTNGVYSRGKNVGRPRFVGPADVVVIDDETMQRLAIAHERTTGQCWDCKGEGYVFDGWSAQTGPRRRDCLRCAGTGDAGVQRTDGYAT